MYKLSILIVFLTAQNLFISCSKESRADEPLLSETFLNIPYGTHEQQKYDIYLPAGRSQNKTKVIVLVHGGGWTDGDKSEMDFIIPYIKARHANHAIVNLNYVLADSTTPAFPNQFLDLKKAIDKITSEKNELHLLPEFGLIGTSAGAHLSMMYAYKYDIEREVKFIADIVGPTDFTDSYYSSDPSFEYLMDFLVDESAYPNNTNYAEVLSPVFNVSNQSCPSLLFYGNTDPLVPMTNAENLSSVLASAGVDHNFTVYDGGHGNWSQSNVEDLIYQISGYIDSYLEITE